MKLQPLTKLERKLRAELRRVGADTSALLVAVSGGADSVALLDALARWRTRQTAGGKLCLAHLNHQLRGAESDADEDFVRDLAARWNLPAVIERQDVQAEVAATGQNLEAMARQSRYEFLQRAAQICGTPFVLTAHTQDDQAETVLLRLLRGSGATGLRGIQAQMLLAESCQLLRPMLTVTRAEVLAHCAQYGLAYCTDSSNLSADFTRNRIRHELLPMLRTFNPRVTEGLARTAELLTVEEVYWDSLTQQTLTLCLASAGRLSVPALLAQPLALRRRILRAWGQAAGITLEAVHLAALEQLASRSQSGRQSELPDGWRVTREFDELRLTRVEASSPLETQVVAPLVWQTASPVEFGGYKFQIQRDLARLEGEQLAAVAAKSGWAVLLRESLVLDEIVLRARRVGDAYIPVRRHRPVKLKTLLIRHKIAKGVRDVYPVLVVQRNGEEAILGGPGLPVAAAFVPLPDSPNCALLTACKA